MSFVSPNCFISVCGEYEIPYFSQGITRVIRTTIALMRSLGGSCSVLGSPFNAGTTRRGYCASKARWASTPPVLFEHNSSADEVNGRRVSSGQRQRADT